LRIIIKKSEIAPDGKIAHKYGPFYMSRKTSQKINPEVQLLQLLKQVLPRATHDPELAGKIYAAVEAELKAKSQTTAFEKFCTAVELPDLEPKTLNDVKLQLASAFGAGGEVTIEPNPEENKLQVEIELPDGTQLQSQIPVRPVAPEGSEEQEIVLKFAPCPVSLPGDPELVWLLAKRENMTAEEAGMALARLEDDFWASKTGQKLLRDRVERSFPEFISRAPAGLLTEAGLKRHYKTPEPVKVLRPLTPQKRA
jgi:hypothetical protein